MSASRREFLHRSCCAMAGLGAAATLSRFGLLSALAQSGPDYKALVCIFLYGGNDANNMVVPITTAEYNNYAALRSVLAIPRGSLLPLTTRTGETTRGLHPAMPHLQTLFNQRHAAILCNVGTLVRPLTRDQFLEGSTPVPANLFSHSDQTDQWQTAQPLGLASSGWAGRMADKIQGEFGSPAVPPIISISGAPIFLTGEQTQPFALDPGAPPGLNGFDVSETDTARFLALQQLLTLDSGVAMVQATSSTTTRAIQLAQTLADSLASAPPLQTVFPPSYIGQQLRQVATLLQVRSVLGTRRQIFFCSLGGFDTHADQLPEQQALLGQLSPALAAFYTATTELGVASQVTTFTLSEFGRSLQPASGAGSDHGWGSHHVIVGGAVQGASFYGNFPTLAFSGPDDADDSGRWIPSTAIDQYGATLASWFGVSNADLGTVFPNLENFTIRNLGFLG